MNDLELEAKLKSAPVPGRTDEYWDDFPSRVRVQLRRQSSASAPRRTWRIPMVWTGDFALTIVLVFLCLQYHPLQAASAAISQHEQRLHTQLVQLDLGLHRLMLNTDGMGYLLAEAN